MFPFDAWKSWSLTVSTKICLCSSYFQGRVQTGSQPNQLNAYYWLLAWSTIDKSWKSLCCHWKVIGHHLCIGVSFCLFLRWLCKKILFESTSRVDVLNLCCSWFKTKKKRRVFTVKKKVVVNRKANFWRLEIAFIYVRQSDRFHSVFISSVRNLDFDLFNQNVLLY